MNNDEYNGNSYDRLNDIFDKQKQFQTLIGTFPILTHPMKQEFVNEQALALIVEISEALQNTKFKSWKKNQIFDSLKYKKEIIDCWHFLINLTVVEMSSEEFYKLFCEKNKENVKRQLSNY